MILNNNSSAKVILILCTVMSCVAAVAQDVARNETVENRARPELDALGLPLGGFRLFPELDAGLQRNNNIFATDRAQFSDNVYVVAPAFEIRSGWSRHAVSFGADAEIIRYERFSNEDHENFSVFGEARIDTARGRFFLLEAFRQHKHEERGSPDDTRGFTPTPFDHDKAVLSFATPGAAGLFQSRLLLQFEKLDYDDVVGSSGSINNDDRDRSSSSGTVRIGYGFHPAYSVFLQGAAQKTDYEFAVDDRGFERSSTGFEVIVGTSLDFSGKTFGDIFAGYLSKTYDDVRFDKIDGPSFGADLTWNVSGLTTVTVSGRREIEPTTVADTAGRDIVRLAFGVDHELLRNLVLELRGSSATEDFNGIDREDRVQAASFSARYLINRWMEMELGVHYTDRDTNQELANIDFSKHVYRLTLKGKL